MEYYSKPKSEYYSESALKEFIIKVFNWMFAGLLITGLTAYLTYITPAIQRIVFANTFTPFIFFIVEIALVSFLIGRIQNMSYQNAVSLFLLYSAVNGLTLSAIFMMYTAESIAGVFLIAAGIFGVMSVYGYTTKTNLLKFGNIFFMGLIGIIIASVVNLFLASSALYWIVSYAGVALFTGLTAYDVQKLKHIFQEQDSHEVMSKKALIGALALYLDFINLFIFLLRIFGRRD